MQCSNNLKQLGLAAHTHADANQSRLPIGARDWNFFTWAMFILPYIEQTALYDSMYIPYTGKSTSGSEEGRYDNAHNLAQWHNADVNCYSCPSYSKNTRFSSNPASNANAEGPKISYLACCGQTAIACGTTAGGFNEDASRNNCWASNFDANWNNEHGASGDILDARGALFGMLGMRASETPGTDEANRAARALRFATPNGQLSLSQATDGLSNTVMFAETIQTENVLYPNGSAISDFRGDAYRGGHGAFFSTYWEPNTKQPDHSGMGYSLCHHRPIDGSFKDVKAPCYTYTYYYSYSSARSYHTGGINAAFGDGSIHFISDTVSRDVWRSLGAASDGKAVSIP